jgi:hypothetical protein
VQARQTKKEGVEAVIERIVESEPVMDVEDCGGGGVLGIILANTKNGVS